MTEYGVCCVFVCVRVWGCVVYYVYFYNGIKPKKVFVWDSLLTSRLVK